MRNRKNIGWVLRNYTRTLINKKFLVVAISLGVGVIAMILNMLFVKPMYRSFASVYIGDRDVSECCVAKDYAELLTCDTVMENVILNKNLDLSKKELNERIVVEHKEGTHFVKLFFKYEDSIEAKKILDEFIECANTYGKEKMSLQKISVIDYSNVDEKPITASPWMSAFWGILVGLIVSVVYISVRYGMNDTIKNERDVYQYFGKDVMAVIPKADNQSNRRKA